MVANSILRSHRQAILGLAERHGVSNVRVFGSAARGEIGPQSDIDLIVDLAPTATLINLGAMLMDLEELLGRRVDVVTEQGLHRLIRDEVLKQAVPLAGDRNRPAGSQGGDRGNADTERRGIPWT